eukprot:7665724-Alexandrium_andersonii.AAC.1
MADKARLESHTMDGYVKFFMSVLLPDEGRFSRLMSNFFLFYKSPLLVATACSGTDGMIKWLSCWDKAFRDMLAGFR